MPQAYRMATGPAEARTSSPVAVSCSRGASPLPGSTGTSARRQDSMLARLSRGRLGDAGGGNGGRAALGGLFEGGGEGYQPWLGPAGPEERDADGQARHVPARDGDRRAAGHRGRARGAEHVVVAEHVVGEAGRAGGQGHDG